MKTILKFVRPSKNVDFFNLTKLEDKSLSSDIAIFFYQNENGGASEVENKWSEDELTLTRTITWTSAEKRAEFEAEVKAKFPSFLELRKKYIEDNGILFTSEEIE
jgi:hypothetical protein